MLRIGIVFCSLLVLIGTLFGSGNTSVVHAASSSPLPYNDNGSSENPPLVLYNAIAQYSGDPFVQHHPKVYLVFWGPEWNTDPDGVIPQVMGTFRALGGSQYNNILSQYSDGTDYVHNDVQVAASVIDTSTPPSNLDIGFETPVGVWDNAQIRNEADKLIAANHWSVNQDSQVIVFPQKGSTYSHGSSFCGVHSYDSTAASPYAYAEIQYGDQSSCDSTGEVADDIAWTAVHEYAEMATDPMIFVSPTIGGQWYVAYGAGWHTEDGTKSTPQEVADLCEGYGGNPRSTGSDYAYNDYVDPASGTYYTLPLLWSNANNGCMTAIGQDYASPASPGRHTVQGSILGEYVHVGQDASVIGPPISEEMPIGSGRVSYFTGGCGASYPTGNCAAIYWSSGSGAHYVRNAEYQEYVAVGQAASVIGFPVTDDTAIGNGGAVTYFNGTCGGTNKCAAIYWSGGSGAHYVRNAEFQEYQKVGEAASVIGFPVTDDTAIGNGGAVTYFNGTCGGTNKCAAIYWSGGSGAHYVRNAEYQEYVAVGQAASVVGFPVTDDTAIGNGGAVTYFNGTCGGTNKCAAIYWSGNTGAQLVRGGDYQLYVTLGEANGILGFPTTREISTNGGSVQYFSKNDACNAAGPNNSDSAIYWSPGTGSHEVHGCIYNFYQQFGGLNSALGFPVSDEEGITDYWGDPGRVSYFKGAYCGNGGPDGSGSAIYWWGGAHEVQGCIYAKYQQIGGSNSKLGFPISNEYTNSLGYRESDFSNGEIIWENGTAVVIYQTGCVTTGKCN